MPSKYDWIQKYSKKNQKKKKNSILSMFFGDASTAKKVAKKKKKDYKVSVGKGINVKRTRKEQFDTLDEQLSN